MSIVPYAFRCNEATKLKDKGLSIEVAEDDEGNEQFSFTREDGEPVAFNNIYSKAEVDQMALGKDFKIDSFKDLTITGGQSLPVFADGATNTQYCTTYNKLMELLRTNFNNLTKYIHDLNIDGVDLSDLANTDISLSQMNYIDNNNIIQPHNPSSINDVIKTYNSSNTSIQSLLSNMNGFVKKSGFENTDIYPNGQLNLFGSSLSNNLNATNNIKTYANLFTSLNTNNANLLQILNGLQNDISTASNSDITNLLNTLENMEYLVVLKINDRYEIRKVKCQKAPSGDDLPVEPTKYDVIVNPDDNKEYDIEDVDTLIENKSPISHDNMDKVINVVVKTSSFMLLLLKSTFSITGKLLSYTLSGVSSMSKVTYNTATSLMESLYFNSGYIWHYTVDTSGKLVRYLITFKDRVVDALPTIDSSTVHKVFDNFGSFIKWLQEPDNFLICAGTFQLTLLLIIYGIKIIFNEEKTYKKLSPMEHKLKFEEMKREHAAIAARLKKKAKPTPLSDEIDILTDDNPLLDVASVFVDTIDLVNNLCEAHNYVMDRLDEIPAGDSNFASEAGIDEFIITNKDVSSLTNTINNIECNLLVINVPDEQKQAFLSYNRPIFKIVLRKNVIYDSKGRYIKEFYIVSKNNKILCPVIKFDSYQNFCIINDSSLIATRSIGPADQNDLDGKFYIAFDKKLPFIHISYSSMESYQL